MGKRCNSSYYTLYCKITPSPTTTRGFLGSLIRKSIVGLLPQSGVLRNIGKIQPYSAYTRRSDPSEFAPKMPIDSEISVALKDPQLTKKPEVLCEAKQMNEEVLRVASKFAALKYQCFILFRRTTLRLIFVRMMNDT